MVFAVALGDIFVSGDTGDGEFPTVMDQSKPSEPKGLLMVGGQLGDYPNNWIVDLKMALAAAKSFYIHGGFDDADTWSRV